MLNTKKYLGGFHSYAAAEKIGLIGPGTAKVEIETTK
jgi:hypothetical protein